MSASSKRFLLVLDDGFADLQIRAALPADSVDVVRLADALNGAGLPGRATPDVAIVGCSSRPDDALRAIEMLSSDLGLPTIVLCEGGREGFLEAAFRAGAEDFHVLPQSTAQLAFAFEKAVARRRGGVAADPAGSLVVVLGPKGGTGKTLTACNLAVALAQTGARPVVVDLDLQFGDVGLALGVRPTSTIYDLAVAGGSLDADKIDSFLVDHPSGVRLLLAPTRPDQAAAVGVALVQQVLQHLRSRYAYVVVDTPPAFSPEVIAAIDASSHVCVVGMLDTLSLKDTKIGLETLEQMGYATDDVTLVLNRADSSVGIGRRDVRQLLGKTPDVLVPSDRAIPKALTSGRTIVEADPGSGPAKAFASLAVRYLSGGASVEEPEQEDESRGGHRLALLRRAS